MFDKKNLLAAFFALLLLAGCGGASDSPAAAPLSSPSPAAAPAPAPQSESEPAAPAYYAAYAGVAADYEQLYGQAAVQHTDFDGDRLTTLTGVCVARLVDFDQNGVEELLLIWAEGDSQYPSYSYGVWTSPDGQSAQLLREHQILDGIQSYAPFLELIEKTDGVYLGEDVDIPDTGWGRAYLRLFSGQFNDALFLTHPGETEQAPAAMQADPDGYDQAQAGFFSGAQEQPPQVNGNPASYDKYAQAQEDFLDGAQVEQIRLTCFSFSPAAGKKGVSSSEDGGAYLTGLVTQTRDTIQALRDFSP